jgi:hypothetical protein
MLRDRGRPTATQRACRNQVIDESEVDRPTRRDAARLPPASMPAGLMFWLMAIPVTLSLFNAISTIIG